ncbi:class I SAM-dependent methyltransferase [Prosthecobacter sp.]|uniref:class I SAM-dependent methyltransferase n=1 Tax=Prosthecobacter sp. TaxID=1965333 RepID=UPI00248A47C3|nr:class I SAM-dependent methyltransferase [Prosthecobacter sp.]MDI1310838.1 methyltransferase domain-containing protein [Prosthecobacter sp.]
MSSEVQRTPERLRHHFEVERELAHQMRQSTQKERTELFKTLYTQLFERVPDHPRLTRRETPESSRRKVESQMRLLRPFLRKDSVFLEFAPGDCRLAAAVAKEVHSVVGVDISDQRSGGEQFPDNLELIVYDGYNLAVADASVDVVFSYQFLEHLHPEDVDAHFAMAHRLLKPGGVYVFDTPHRYSGPHDISRHFGNELVCFHFQEWTSSDMRHLLKKHGFSHSSVYRFGKPVFSRFLNRVNDLIELAVGWLPAPLRQKISRRLFPSVTMFARA